MHHRIARLVRCRLVAELSTRLSSNLSKISVISIDVPPTRQLLLRRRIDRRCRVPFSPSAGPPRDVPVFARHTKLQPENARATSPLRTPVVSPHRHRRSVMKQRVRQHVGFVASSRGPAPPSGPPRSRDLVVGTLDGNLHPNVGVVIFAVDGELCSPCCGKPDCAYRLCYGCALRGIHRVSGATEVWVTFDSHVVADVDFIEVSNLDTSTLIPGTLHPNPAFDAHAPIVNDVAVIAFETPVVGLTPAVLQLPVCSMSARTTRMELKPIVHRVGYGVNQTDRYCEGPPTLVRDLNRRFATSGLDAPRASVTVVSR